MTDEMVGPELPAATGGWTNGRARVVLPSGTDYSDLAGCWVWGGSRPGHHPSHPLCSCLRAPSSSDSKAFIAPLRKERQGN